MNKKKPSRNYEEINKEGIELFANSRKYNQATSERKEIPHDYYINSNGGTQCSRCKKFRAIPDWPGYCYIEEPKEPESWEEELEDVINEDYPEINQNRLEDFIRELLQSQKEELKKKVEELKRVESDKAIQGAIDGGFNVALQEVLKLFN